MNPTPPPTAATGATRFFHLRQLPPFDRLHESELAVLADVLVERHYAPGQRVASEGKPLKALFLTVGGALTDGAGRVLPPVFRPGLLVRGAELEHPVVADPAAGAHCYLLGRGHFFTTLFECPSLTLGFAEMEGGEADR